MRLHLQKWAPRKTPDHFQMDTVWGFDGSALGRSDSDVQRQAGLATGIGNPYSPATEKAGGVPLVLRALGSSGKTHTCGQAFKGSPGRFSGARRQEGTTNKLSPSRNAPTEGMTTPA
jgi:hypothetical protein